MRSQLRFLHGKLQHLGLDSAASVAQALTVLRSPARRNRVATAIIVIDHSVALGADQLENFNQTFRSPEACPDLVAIRRDNGAKGRKASVMRSGGGWGGGFLLR